MTNAILVPEVIYMKKAKKMILPWVGIFALCLVMVFLLMKGFIVTESMIG